MGIEEDEAEALRPGVRIGSYEVERQLGSGAMATVFQVRHVYLDTVHALKLVSIEHGTLRERLWFEGQLQSRVVHPNVVQIREMLVHDGHPALILEYVEGCTIADLLVKGALDPSVVDDLARDLIEGVRAAHAAGIVHRDLKPENIFLSKSPERWIAKVGDFGIARGFASTGGMTQAGFPLGTPRYMSPEQYRDAHGVDVRADLFSIGCVLYEMLSGRVAFPEEDLELLRRQIITGTVVPLSTVRPDLPRRMLDTVQRCLATDPGARPANCDELLALWSGRSPATRSLGSEEPTTLLAVRRGAPARKGDWELLPFAALAFAGLTAFSLVFVAAAIVVSTTWVQSAPEADPVPVIEVPPWVVGVPPVVAPATEPALAAEPPIPAPARPMGTVTQEGADWVLLVGPGGALPAGRVPAGTYIVRAGFQGLPPIPAGEVTVAPGAQVHLRCHPKFRRCVVDPHR